MGQLRQRAGNAQIQNNGAGRQRSTFPVTIAFSAVLLRQQLSFGVMDVGITDNNVGSQCFAGRKFYSTRGAIFNYDLTYG